MPTVYYANSEDIWNHWSDTITTTSCISGTADIYTTWVNAATSTTATISTSSNLTWSTWTSVGAAENYAIPSVAAEVATPEQLAERAARQERLMQESAQRAAAAVAAEERAERLLLENLDAQQQRDWRERHHFTIHGRSGRRYRVRRGRNGNVDVIDRAGKVEHRLCAHPRVWLPDPDTNLAQKLLIEEDEDAFARVANRHPSFDRNPVVMEALH